MYTFLKAAGLMRQPLNPLNPLFNNVENREILKVSSVIFQHYEIKGKVFQDFSPQSCLMLFTERKGPTSCKIKH